MTLPVAGKSVSIGVWFFIFPLLGRFFEVPAFDGPLAEVGKGVYFS